MNQIPHRRCQPVPNGLRRVVYLPKMVSVESRARQLWQGPKRIMLLVCDVIGSGRNSTTARSTAPGPRLSLAVATIVSRAFVTGRHLRGGAVLGAGPQERQSC